PEGDDARYSVGITSFLALIVLLFASAIAKNLPVRKFKRIWLIAAAIFFCSAVVSTFWYKHNLDRLTFAYPPEAIRAQYIKGTEMTTEAKEFEERTKKSDSSVVAAYGGPSIREIVWTSESIRRAKLILSSSYSIL